MIAFFRKNILSISLMLLPYAIFLRIKAVFDPIAYVPKGNETSFFMWIAEAVSSPLSQAILTIFLVFTQGVAINRLVIKNRISQEQSLIPGMMYILFASMLPDFLILTPALISTSFIIYAISSLFKIYGKKRSSLPTFNVGFLISLATIVYPPTLMFFIIGIIGFVMLRSIQLKGLLQMFFAAIFPYYMIGVYYYLKDQFSDFYSFFEGGFTWYNGFSTIFQGPYYAFAIVLVASIFFIFNYTTYIKGKSIQTQEKIDILYMYLIMFLASVFIVNFYSDSMLTFVLVPISIFFTLWLLRIKNPIIIEFIHFGFIILLVCIHYIF